MIKYIVTFKGCTARPGFSFERVVDIYEIDDNRFIEKLDAILEFKNRHTYRLCTADYHVESVSKIVKIIPNVEDPEDYARKDILCFDDFESVSDSNLIKFKALWDDDAYYQEHLISSAPAESQQYYQAHFDANMLIH